MPRCQSGSPTFLSRASPRGTCSVATVKVLSSATIIKVYLQAPDQSMFRLTVVCRVQPRIRVLLRCFRQDLNAANLIGFPTTGSLSGTNTCSPHFWRAICTAKKLVHLTSSFLNHSVTLSSKTPKQRQSQNFRPKLCLQVVALRKHTPFRDCGGYTRWEQRKDGCRGTRAALRRAFPA